MQKFTSLVGRLAVVAAGALALGACNRAEYAMLPRSASYLGTKTVASTPRPAAPAVAPVAAAEETLPAVATPAVAPAPVPPAPALAAAPAKLAPATHPEASSAAPVAAASTPAPAKLNLVQRLALHKITKKLDKLTAKAPQLKQRGAAAGTARIDGGLRTAIVVLLISLLVAILASVGGAVGTLFAILASILFIIGIVLLILYLLDQV